MIFGMDYLGGAMFPKVLITNHPGGWAAGFFDSTFGNCWGVADRLLATGKCPRIRIHGPWTDHRYNSKRHDKAIFAALKKANALKAKYPRIHVQFSPVCECDDPWGDLLDRCGDASRDVEIVASVGTKGQFSKKFMNEVHGATKKPNFGAYQYSDDGESTVDSDVEATKENHKEAQVIYYWHQNFNLKYKVKLSGDESAEVKRNDSAPPLKRNCKPTGQLIKSMEVLAGPKGVTHFPKSWLHGKSHADRHNTPPDPKAYKPVYIANVDSRYARIELKTPNGIVPSSKPEPFNDKKTGKLIGWRYYFPKYGYEIATKPCEIIAEGKVIGTVNPAFRDGSFR